MTSRIGTSLPDQVARMEKADVARRSRYRMKDTHITLSHGSGGKASHHLIEGLLIPILANPVLDGLGDSAIISPNGNGSGRLAFTTDTYVVSPLFFPGGDIGCLAVHGTLNDLAMSGARPLCLSVGLILEEGLLVEVLERVTQSIADAARSAGVAIVTGDTKVVERGKADQLFVNTSGIGLVPDGADLLPERIQTGDRVLISGTVADHGMAVMLAREALDMEADISSDTAALHELVDTVLAAAPNTRMFRDPTRGGVATSLNEIAGRAACCIRVDEDAVPVKPAVRGACELLGIDPLHIANEGKLLAVIPAAEAHAALAAMHGHELGRDAAIIGEVVPEPVGMVVLNTGIGGSRVLDMLVGDPLPRIC